MQSLATKLTALLIALLFLGATAQCNALCAQPEQHQPPCHKQSASCTSAPLTAERTASAAIPIPIATFLPASFVPVVIAFNPPCVLVPPATFTFKRTVLLI